MRYCFTLLVVAMLPTLGVATEQQHEKLLFDFDTRLLSSDWSAIGRNRIIVAREHLPDSDSDSRFAPSKWGVTVKTQGDSGLFCRSENVPQDWTGFDTLSFWVHRDKDQENVSTIEVQFFESDGKAKFWRKLDIEHTGWKRYSVPLSWFRWGDGRIPRWKRIDRLGFWFRHEMEISLDSIAVHVISSPRRDFPSADQIAKVAFDANDGSRIQRAANVEIITNSSQLDVATLTELLSERITAFHRDFSFLSPPDHPPILIVFRDREQYERFVPRIGGQFNSVAPPPKSSGYSFFGFAMSFWVNEFGTDRPVYTHEIIHSVLERTIRIACHGDWLHEGLASMYQLRAHPQKDFSQIVDDGIENERYRLPLKRLCSGNRIPMNRYWQASTLWEMILESPTYRERLPQLFRAFQRLGSSNLNPHLELLGTSWEMLTDDWIAFCQARYVDA